MQKSLVLLILLGLVGVVQAPSLTVTPSDIQMDQVESGSVESFNIYVDANDVSEPVEVSPNVEGPFGNTLFGNEQVDSEQVSDESMQEWISFEEDSVVANPGDSESFTLEDGSEVTASNQIPAEIQVPEDAEPGYHAARIGFSASGVGEGSGFATTNWVLPYIEVIVEVEGNAERSVTLQDARALRIGESQAQIIANLQNTGTVTTEVDGGTVNILNEDDQKVGEIQLGSTRVPPGEFQEVSAEWESDDLEPGTYSLDGTGDFVTGQFYIGDQVSIQQAIQESVEIEDPDGESTEDSGDMPTWLIVMVLMLLGVIMYSFDIDPLWIVLIVGLLAISTFVLVTDLPLYLIGITLIVGFSMVYYGVV